MNKLKKKNNFLIENRYKISGILLIILTILQYFFILGGKLSNEMFNGNLLNNKLFLAFYSNLKFFGLLLVSYELCQIITNNKRGIAVVGAIMITFSSVAQLQFSNIFIEILVLGELAIVLLNKFMTSEKFKIRVCCLLGITASVILYFFTYLSSYMISLGYVFLALAIWIVIKNKKQTTISKKDMGIIVVCILVIIGVCFWYFQISSNNLKILPDNNEIEQNRGNGIAYLFSYLYNFLLPFMDMGDNASLANIISVFPVPMIMALYYIYKKEKHISYLLPLSIVAVLETVYCISGFPGIISKIALLEGATVDIVSVAVRFANFYLLLYMLSNIEEELVSMKVAVRIAIIVMCIIVFVPLPGVISSRGYVTLVSGILCMYTFLFLNNSDERYRNVLLTFLVIFTLIGGLFVK